MKYMVRKYYLTLHMVVYRMYIYWKQHHKLRIHHHRNANNILNLHVYMQANIYNSSLDHKYRNPTLNPNPTSNKDYNFQNLSNKTMRIAHTHYH